MHRNSYANNVKFTWTSFAYCFLFLLLTIAPGAAQSPSYTVLHSFDSNSTNGMRPHGHLVEAPDGNFYGIVGDLVNDSHSCRVYRITPTGSLTSLALLPTGSGASNSSGLIKASDGNLYGSVAGGGTSGRGMVLKVVPSTGTVSILYSFSGGSDGDGPDGLLCQASDGNLYGGTDSSSGGWGTLFRLTLNGVLTTLHTFSQSCEYCEGGMIQATDGSLYGATSYGGAYYSGRVFKMTLSGILTTVYDFRGISDGAYPRSRMLQAADGCLYGMTFYTSFDGCDGYDGYGTVFKLTPSGNLTTIHTFDGADGSNPLGPLTAGSDGCLYGTTDGWVISGGWSPGNGTIFKMSTGGAVTTLSSAPGPYGGIIQGSDGAFYGTAPFGGAYNCGIVFKL